MKTISKRILCLIVSICICFTALPIIFSIKADASEPQLSSRCETAINIEVKEASFGEDAADLLSNTAIKLTASMDLSTADVFELDVYIEDINALKAFTTNSQYVQFGFSSRSNRPNTNNANINISSQLLQDGWNHIEVKKANFVEANINWSKIYYVYLKFADETQTLPAELANKTVKYMNICESMANPAMDPDIIPEMIGAEGMLVIKEGVKDSGTYGSAKNIWEPNIDFGENKDLSGYDYFQFDYYVENLENLKQLASRLYLNFVSDQSKSQCDIDFLDLLTKDGWNHVKVPKSTASTMSKTRYIRFRITKKENVTVGSEDCYKTANLVATFRDGSEPYSFNQSVTVGKDQTEIIVTWLDTVDRDGKVVLTKNSDETEFVAVKRFAEEKGLYSYSATITGLTANTSYTYRIVAGDLKSDEYTYKTKDFDDTFSFVHIADVQYNGSSNLLENWKNTLSKINTNFPETSFIVDSGDVSDLSGNNDLYQAVKSPELLKQYAMSVVPGNHDNSKAEDGGGYYTLNFASPNTYEPYEGYALNGYDYWFSYNNILFISLNSLISDVQYHKDFMTKVVEEQGDKFDWIIVNCHYSLFGASYHSTESATINHRDGLAPLFTELGVDLVLSGHDHVYDRSYLMDGVRPKADTNDFATSADGVLYISATTASGMKFNTAVDSCKSYSAKIVEKKYGFINYEVSEDEITLTFYNAEDMSVLDAFTLYNDNGDHSVYADSDLLKDKNLQNIKLDSNGNYTVSFDSANITDACTVELDFGLANGNALSDISISLVDANENSATKDFSNLQSGWNHLVANISDFNGVDLTKITAVKLTGIAGTELDIANLYVGHIYTDRGDTTCNGCDHEREILDDLDPYVIPEMIQSEGMLVIKEGVKDSGTYGSAKNIWEPNIDFGDNENLLGYDYFEFDYYVENLENLKQLASRLYLNFVDRTGGNQCDIDFLHLLTKDGWNHVKVATSTASNVSALSTVRFIRFRIVKNSDVTVGSEDRYKTANLCAILGEISMLPDLPENVITEIEEKRESTFGGYFGYISDRVYAEGIGPYDFSQGNVIEFDIYISDYEALKKSFDECPRGKNLYIVFSSVPLNLMDQYSKPRTYYSVQYSISDKITKSGWNHIEIGKKEFSQLLGTMDWSNVTSYMLRYSDCKFNTRDPEEVHPASDVIVKIVNIVNTGVLSKVPYDEKQPVKPDKDAVYISDAENLADNNGTWNPASVYVNENFKTENSCSVTTNIAYDTDINLARIFYLFDDSANMSDIKTLKFDFFIDLPQFIQKSGNVIEVGVSSERNYINNNYSWQIDISSLEEGWNLLSFDISKAQKSGNVSLDEIKTIYIRFSEINLSAEDYETIIMGVDNLRYLSKNGNTTLRINGLTDYVEENDNTNDSNDLDFDNNNSDKKVQEVITETIKSEPKTFHQKQTVHKTVTNYIVAIIILCAEFAVLTAASIITFVILKKKKKI